MPSRHASESWHLRQDKARYPDKDPSVRWGDGLARAWIALLLLLCAATAHAQTFPKLTGRVVDGAGLLNPQQAADLDAKLTAIETQSGRQFVVATVPDLQGYEIDDYGYRLGRAWGIGGKQTNDGVLLLVAPKERKVRIEVGYGLEPYLTDALSSVIINTQITPRFRQGDMPAGIAAGADAIIEQLRLPQDQAQARQQQILSQSKSRRDQGVPIAAVFWIVVAFFVLISFIARRSRGRQYNGSVWPVILWSGLNELSRGSGGGWSSGGGSDWGGGGGGFSGGGGSFGGGGASGGW